MSGRGRRLVLAAAVAGAAAYGCTEIGTDPDVPVAIELHAPQLPSLVAGDQLRDTLGNPVPLAVVVLDGSGDTIAQPGVRFIALDTAGVIAVDGATGHVAGTDTGRAAVVADANGLQSAPVSLTVVPMPTRLAGLDSPVPDTLRYTFSVRDTLVALGVRLEHEGGAATVPVRSHRVEFRIVHPDTMSGRDSTAVMLVTDQRRASLVDTTDASGVASRSLRVTPFTRPFADSVVVEASAWRPDRTAVPGSPVRFKVVVVVE